MTNQSLTQSKLKSFLHYSQENGVFSSLRNNSSKTGCPDKDGYIVIQLEYKKYKAHRLAWLYVYGKWPKDQIDHINHNRSDNSINNLREASIQENSKNKAIYKTNKSGISGVIWIKSRNRYESNIVDNKIRISLGSFTDFFEACCARKSAESKLNYHYNHGLNI